MSEPNARLLLSVAGGSSVLGYVVAIVLGLQGNQGMALVFLILSLIDSAVAFFLYRSYTSLRHVRWQGEIKESEDKMQRMMDEEAGKSESSPNA